MSETKSIIHIENASLSNLANKQIGVLSGNDSDLGFRCWGGKDGAGSVSLFLAKDEIGRLQSLYLLDLDVLDSAGLVKYDSDGLLAGGGVLDDLADVVITTPAEDEILQYNGSNWVNAELSLTGETTLDDAYDNGEGESPGEARTITVDDGVVQWDVDPAYYFGISGNLRMWEDLNDGSPEIRLGSADANEAHIQAVYDSGAKTLDYLLISTESGGEGDIVLSPASGFVGIGVTAPQRILHVQASDAPGSSLTSTAVVCIEKNDDAWLEMLTPNNKTGSIGFTDGGSSYGLISYSHSTDAFSFRTATSEKLTISSTGVLTINGRTTLTDDGTTFTILPDTGDYTRVGDATTTSHSLNTNDDILFTSRVEVDGAFYADSLSTFAATATLLDDVDLCFGTGADSYIAWRTGQTPDALMLTTGADSNVINICETADIGFDFAFAHQANPTLAIHSANQNTTEYISFAHNQTDAYLQIGKGGLTVRSKVAVVLADSSSFLIPGGSAGWMIVQIGGESDDVGCALVTWGATGGVEIIASNGGGTDSFAISDSAGDFCIYYDSGSAAVRVKNNLGASISCCFTIQYCDNPTGSFDVPA